MPSSASRASQAGSSAASIANARCPGPPDSCAGTSPPGISTDEAAPFWNSSSTVPSPASIATRRSMSHHRRDVEQRRVERGAARQVVAVERRLEHRRTRAHSIINRQFTNHQFQPNSSPLHRHPHAVLRPQRDQRLRHDRMARHEPQPPLLRDRRDEEDQLHPRERFADALARAAAERESRRTSAAPARNSGVQRSGSKRSGSA